jgi:hypothetical protein
MMGGGNDWGDGGWNENDKNDVWKSTDGGSGWALIRENAEWSGKVLF